MRPLAVSVAGARAVTAQRIRLSIRRSRITAWSVQSPGGTAPVTISLTSSSSSSSVGRGTRPASS